MSLNASIEARMTSSRLPGKVLMGLIEKPVLELMIQRVMQSKYIDKIIVATTINETDNPVVELCKKLNVAYHRGSEEDVLQRVLDAHKKYDSDIIIELTGDCPFIDPAVIDKCVEFYLNNDFDYVSNCLVRSYPMGMEVEIFRTELLDEISRITNHPADREHVSTYLYKSGKYTTGNVFAEPEYCWPDLSLTLDTSEDYMVLTRIKEHFKDDHLFKLNDIIQFLKKNNDIVKINYNIERSGING